MSEFLSGNFQILVVKFAVYLNKRVFVMRSVVIVNVLSSAKHS